MASLLDYAKSGDLLRARQALGDPEQGAEDGIETKDLHDQTVLHLASKNGHKDIVDWALGLGVDVNAQTVAGDTALILATQSGHVDIVKMLTSRKADVNLANDHGNTALHYACFWRREEIALHLLITGSARLMVKNKYGKTPVDRTIPAMARKLSAVAKTNEGDGASPIEAPARSQTEVLEAAKARFIAKAGANWEIPSTTAILFLEPCRKSRHAEVHKGKWNGYMVAVKRLLDQKLAGDDLKAVRAEISMMRKLFHPNISPPLAGCATPPYVCVLTEWAERGTLQKFLRDPNCGMDQDLALKFAMDAARGIAYLHAQGVAAWNVSSSNFLVTEDLSLKLVEFGYAYSHLSARYHDPTRIYTPSYTSPELLRDTSLGSVSAMIALSLSTTNNTLSGSSAVENLRAMEKSFQVGRGVDAYGFGVVLWEIVTRGVPYEGINAMHVGVQVLLEGARPRIPEFVPAELNDIIESCWSDNPASRPPMSVIIEALEMFAGSTVVDIGASVSSLGGSMANLGVGERERAY